MDIKKQLSVAGEGAKLVAKQAERMMVANVSLPGAYRKLGEEIFKAGTLKDKLGDQFTKIQSSIEEQEKLNQAGPAAQGFAEKMKAAAISAKNMAVSKKIDYDRGGLFAELGRLAFESHKEEIKNNLSLAPVEAELAKLVALDAEIAELGSLGQGSFFNPRNVAIGLVAVAGLAVAFIGYKIVFGSLLVESKVNANKRIVMNEIEKFEKLRKKYDDNDKEYLDKSLEEGEIARKKNLVRSSEINSDPDIQNIREDIKKLQIENGTLRDQIDILFWEIKEKIEDLIFTNLDALDSETRQALFGKEIEILFQQGYTDQAVKIAQMAYNNKIEPKCNKRLKAPFSGKTVSDILEEAKNGSSGSTYSKPSSDFGDNSIEKQNKIEGPDYKATSKKNFSISMPKESPPPPKR